MAREFVSGLPGADVRQEKTWEQVLAESRVAIIERRKRDEGHRLYARSQTEGTRQVTARMLGELDE
jgi:hypothetical protein